MTQRSLIVAAALWLAAVALAGCAGAFTDPDRFSLAPAQVSHLQQRVTVSNGFRAVHRAPGRGVYQLTDTAVAMLARAMNQHGTGIPFDSNKTVNLVIVQASSVRDPTELETVLGVVSGIGGRPHISSTRRANVVLEAEFGDGTRTVVSGTDRHMGIPYAVDGAILDALSNLVVDKNFVAYINAPSTSTAAINAEGTSPSKPAISAHRFPQAGDSWTYLLTEHGRGAPPPRRYVVNVIDSSEANISDRVTLQGAPPAESIHTKGRYLVSQGVSVLSPYLVVFENLSVGASLDDVVTREGLDCRGTNRCEVRGEIIGKEIVHVPAGNFESVKVVITQEWRHPSARDFPLGRRQLTVWYAAEVKRFVKFSSRAVNSSTPDFDLELIRYKLVGRDPFSDAGRSGTPTFQY